MIHHSLTKLSPPYVSEIYQTHKDKLRIFSPTYVVYQGPPGCVVVILEAGKGRGGGWEWQNVFPKTGSGMLWVLIFYKIDHGNLYVLYG